MGQVTVERDGVSVEHAARFVLIGTMNPEEGELRPQLLDRFGLNVRLDTQPPPAERAEIILIQYSPHVGTEMPNDHPMLVVSTKAFAERTGIVFGFPMTHAAFHADNPFAIPVNGAKGEVGYVLVHQPKSFDWRLRNARQHS